MRVCRNTELQLLNLKYVICHKIINQQYMLINNFIIGNLLYVTK